METYVVAFDTYSEAREAVDAVTAQGFPEDAINAIVQKSIAKSSAEVNGKTIRAEKSDAHGDPQAHGLDAIVAGKDTVVTEDAGEIVPAGEVARILAKAASGASRGVGTLEASLAESGVPRTLAHNHAARLAAGGVVLMLLFRDDCNRRALMALDPYHPRDGARTRRRGADR